MIDLVIALRRVIQALEGWRSIHHRWINGTADYIARLGIFGVNVSMSLFGTRANSPHGERTYVIPSHVAKSILAWRVFAGTLASGLHPRNLALELWL